VLKKEESRSIGIYIFFSLSLGCLTLVHVQSTHALALPLLHTDALDSLRFLSLLPYISFILYFFKHFNPNVEGIIFVVVPEEEDRNKIFGKGSTCPD
jgi:predicted alpha/beta hydrolase family esterase